MKEPIILISGGTGVGTSTFSFELAKVLGIQNIMGTDFLREVLRNTISGDINQTLEQSTYMAGQTSHYSGKSEELQKSEILRAYKIQCTAVNVGIEGVLRRAINENVPLIIEGVHLRPGKLRDSDMYAICENRLVEYLVHIEDPEIHKDRFIERQRSAPDRPLEKYIENFQEIRWIHDHLVERANRFDEIKLIDNSGDIRSALDDMCSFYYAKRG